MMRNILFPLLLASFVSSLSVTPTNNADDLAKAVLGTTGLTLKSATYSGAAGASGIFTDGPQSIRNAAVLTTGRATDTISKAGEVENIDGVANGGSGSPTLCGQLANGAPSFDAAILTMEVELATGYDGFEAQFVFTTEEYPEWIGSEFNDAFGVYVDGKQVAFDDTGAPITVNGPFFSSGTVITPPQSGSSYNGSTPLLRSGAPASPGTHKIEIAICDVSDRIYDSGVFIVCLLSPLHF